jgi:pSer/pThr/pTyr-binding forkhead associated (FHA) protein
METESPTPGGRPVLRRTVGRGGEWSLTPGATIGRPEALPTIAVDDPAVSPRHARMSLRGGSWWISDLGSRHGTYVNGRRVREAALGPGDIVMVGSTELRFDLVHIPTVPHRLGSQWGTVDDLAPQYAR